MTRRAPCRARAAAVTVAAAGLVAACSVLRIDVDVYKGPLANHTEVQAQQLVAMAIGAHPLLTELRDTMEWDRDCKEDAEADDDGTYRQCIQNQIEIARACD